MRRVEGAADFNGSRNAFRRGIDYGLMPPGLP
jgi:hypothetical protein